MTLQPTSPNSTFQNAFLAQYKQEFGFVLDKPIIVDDIRVRGIGKSFDTLGKGVWVEIKELEERGWTDAYGKEENKKAEVYFEECGMEKVEVYLLGKLRPGDRVSG
jgi:5-oxoprolinase (ATP-hydrolysing)